MPRKKDCDYREVVGMLNFLQGSTIIDMPMDVRQCARFHNDQKLSHERARQRTVRYLIQTKNNDLSFQEHKSKVIESHVDTSFTGG